MEIKNINFGTIDVKDLAALICQHLHDKGINIVLTGGACVSILSHNIYVSKDLDFVPDDILIMARIIRSLKEIGFSNKGRHFIRNDCPFLIEFVNPPLSVGNEKVSKVDKVKTKYGTLNILSPTDCVKDRLAAYYHWDDPQSLEQAMLVAKNNKINLNEIKRWSKNEKMLDKFDVFVKRLKK